MEDQERSAAERAEHLLEAMERLYNQDSRPEAQRMLDVVTRVRAAFAAASSQETAAVFLDALWLGRSLNEHAREDVTDYLARTAQRGLQFAHYAHQGQRSAHGARKGGEERRKVDDAEKLEDELRSYHKLRPHVSWKEACERIGAKRGIHWRTVARNASGARWRAGE